MDDATENISIPDDYDCPVFEYIKPEDDFNRFSRRFTVLEDSDESSFHFPGKPGDSCAGCGKPAEYAVYTVARKTRLLESMPSLDRVASEYRVFGLPFCRKCIPGTELGQPGKDKVSCSGACFFVLMVLLVLTLGTIAVIYYWGSYIDIHPPASGDADARVTAWGKLAGLLLAWGVVFTLICYLINYIASKFKPGYLHVRSKFQSLLDGFIDTLKRDRWEYVDRTPVYPIDKELQFQDIVSNSYHLWGLVYLFRKQLRDDPYVKLFNCSIHELDPANYKSWTTSDPGEAECRLCSKRPGKQRKFMLFRQIGANLGGKAEGYAREYGLLDLPVCDTCWTGNREFQFGGGGKSSMRWMLPVIVFASLTLLASFYIVYFILKTPFLVSDPLWLALTLKILVIPLIISGLLIIGILAGMKIVDVREKKVQQSADGINVQELLIADSATANGWAVMRHPEESDFDLSPNLKYWFDQFGVH